MYLFFDTETTGKPKKWKAPVEDTFNWPRMVQIAWQLYDLEQKLIEEVSCIIKPEGFEIPGEATFIHGISTEQALEEGKDLTEVLNDFKAKINKADTIIAHNMPFDEKIVGAEFIRKNIEHNLFVSERLCTMAEGTYYCKIPGKYGYKWPKLSELHIKLFGKDFEGAHDALADVKATSKCFFKMVELDIID